MFTLLSVDFLSVINVMEAPRRHNLRGHGRGEAPAPVKSDFRSIFRREQGERDTRDDIKHTDKTVIDAVKYCSVFIFTFFTMVADADVGVVSEVPPRFSACTVGR